jgi:hypothetical protein
LVKEYIVNIVRQTREHPDVYLGSSSRGALAIYRLGQARAALLGRDYVLPDDVKALAGPALGHRIIVGPRPASRTSSRNRLCRTLLDRRPCPALRSGGSGRAPDGGFLGQRRTVVFILALVAFIAGLMTGRDLLFTWPTCWACC